MTPAPVIHHRYSVYNQQVVHCKKEIDVPKSSAPHSCMNKTPELNSVLPPQNTLHTTLENPRVKAIFQNSLPEHSEHNQK